MHIIPVIDVRSGVAVRAAGGDRANYKPLVLGGGDATPASVARWYLELHAFPTLYVADLDGIEGRGADAVLVDTLVATFPGVSFWRDAGLRDAGSSSAMTTVVGSETLTEADLARPLAETAVLSLDFRGDTFLGPRALLDSPALWPSRIIVMTLARVGMDGGPDLDRIAEIARRAPDARVYAAGGIRDVADLRAARDAGAHGALIASALHAQKIKADDLDEIIGL